MSRGTAIQSVYHIQLASLKKIKRKEVDILGLFSKPISEKILKLIGKGEFTPEEIEAIKEAIGDKEEEIDVETPKEDETPPITEEQTENAEKQTGEEPVTEDETQTTEAETTSDETPNDGGKQIEEKQTSLEEQNPDEAGQEENPVVSQEEEQPQAEQPKPIEVTIEMVNELKDLIKSQAEKISHLEELVSKLSVSTEINPEDVVDGVVGLSGKGKTTGGNVYAEHDRLGDVKKKLGNFIS